MLVWVFSWLFCCENNNWLDNNNNKRDVDAEEDTTFKEYKYSASDINDFTSFQLKIVMKGSNSSYPPVLRDMRGIALAV